MDPELQDAAHPPVCQLHQQPGRSAAALTLELLLKATCRNRGSSGVRGSRGCDLQIQLMLKQQQAIDRCDQDHKALHR